MTMRQILFAVFSAVCGENPEHVWAPGGEALPCCERCTGLYAGALAAIVLRLWLRPRASGQSLRIHGLFLLQLGLFVFPWMPQGAVLRTISGGLFGFGVVAFLWPAVCAWLPAARVTTFGGMAYAMGLAGCLGLTPAIAEWGGKAGAFVLTGLVLAGAVALAALAGANVARCLIELLAIILDKKRPEFSQ
jgi:uncharacterized membrane protein